MATMPITATITVEEEAETPSQQAEVADLQVLTTKTCLGCGVEPSKWSITEYASKFAEIWSFQIM